MKSRKVSKRTLVIASAVAAILAAAGITGYAATDSGNSDEKATATRGVSDFASASDPTPPEASASADAPASTAASTSATTILADGPTGNTGSQTRTGGSTTTSGSGAGGSRSGGGSTGGGSTGGGSTGGGSTGGGSSPGGGSAPAPAPAPPPPPPVYPSYIAPSVGSPQLVSCSHSGSTMVAAYKITLSGGRYSISTGGMSRLDIGWNGGSSTYSVTVRSTYPDTTDGIVYFFRLLLADPGSTDGTHPGIPATQFSVAPITCARV